MHGMHSDGISHFAVKDSEVESNVTSDNSTDSYTAEDDATNKTNSVNFIEIPARTFENITANKTGVFFSLYADNALFPLRLNQTIADNVTYQAIGSSVISASVAGQNITGLREMINITLSINIDVSKVHEYT